jgi:hypothetical protein
MRVRVNRLQDLPWSFVRRITRRPLGSPCAELNELGTGEEIRVTHAPQLHPLVPPQVSHLRQVPLRTRVKLPHSRQLSPS